MTDSDIDPIIAQRTEWKAAFEARDIERTMAFYHDDDVTYDINPPLQFASTSARRENWENFFGGFTGQLTIEFANEHIVRSDDLAVDYHLTRVAGTTTYGPQVDLWTRQTNVLRRIDGVWLFVNNHLSFPADLAANKPATDLRP